jgi:hypothetical protein
MDSKLLQILKLVLESKSVKNKDFHRFSTHFCVGTIRESILSNVFFFIEAVLR